MVDEQKQICQECKKRKNKKCQVTDKYVARKKLCDINEYSKKGK